MRHSRVSFSGEAEMALTPFFIITLSTAAESAAGIGGVETLGTIGGAVFALYGLYKLGTIETILKIGLTVVIAMVVLYAAGYANPELQSATWYQLVAYIMEWAPRIIMQQLGGIET